ncbi:MAG: 50S ribosomal protein L28 [Firmicutes bacterium]|nr:50S ribosomal protein L28 [Bacillota bacterium]MCL5038297.1 50S ribosomal protein L28 [Bacillota bacterium]
MAHVCEICGKGIGHGNKVSHSNIKTRRVWLPNVQRVKALISGRPKTIYVCSSCLKAGKVQRAI